MLEDLNIAPQDFSAALGRDIFSQVMECQNDVDDDISDSSDTSAFSDNEQGGIIGGICSFKVLPGIMMC